ncbi:MAG: hypothetical protein LBR37_03800 [Erysipelotrichaceae bacterium]|nr:hypothetical protein [Erysipelotrichaceae bacterium]
MKLRKAIYIIFLILIILAILAVTVLLFAGNAFHFVNSFIDLFSLFGLKIDYLVIPENISVFGIRIINIDASPLALDNMFLIQLKVWPIYLINQDNIFDYISLVLNFLMTLTRIIMIVLIVYVFLKLLFTCFMAAHESSSLVAQDGTLKQKETKGYQVFMFIRNKIIHFDKLKFEVISFFRFLINNLVFKITLIIVSCFILNAIPIIISLFLMYVYMFAFDATFFTFIPKLIRYFLPALIYLWPIIIVFVIRHFNKVRRWTGINRLMHREALNEAAVSSMGVMNCVVGPPGDGKTTLITDFSMSFEAKVRFTVLEILNKYGTMFPDFNFEFLEFCLRQEINAGRILNRVHIKAYIDRISFMYYYPRKRLDHDGSLKDRANVKGHEPFIFGYKSNKMHSYDGLKIITIFDALIIYLEAYYLFIQDVPLATSNYPINYDHVAINTGHFIKFDYNYFERSEVDLLYYDSKAFSININYDDFRLGKKFDPERISYFDSGVITYTELDKERGNKDDLQSLSKDDDFVNQLNDSFQDFHKVIRHSRTLDHQPLIKVFCDMQASSDIQAKIRHLFDTIITIEKDPEAEILYPFNWFLYPLQKKVLSKINEFRSIYRENRRDLSLLSFLANKIAAKLQQKLFIFENTYQSRSYTLIIKHGSEDKDQESKKVAYFIQPKKIYSERFATDIYKPVFENTYKDATVSVYHSAQFKSLYPSSDDLEYQEGYWPKRLLKGLFSGLKKKGPSGPGVKEKKDEKLEELSW